MLIYIYWHVHLRHLIKKNVPSGRVWTFILFDGESTIKPGMLLNCTAMQDFHSEGRFNYPVSEMHTLTRTCTHTYTHTHIHKHLHTITPTPSHIYAINIEIIFQVRGTNIAIAFWSNALLLFYKFYNISVLLYEN